MIGPENFKTSLLHNWFILEQLVITSKDSVQIACRWLGGDLEVCTAACKMQQLNKQQQWNGRVWDHPGWCSLTNDQFSPWYLFTTRTVSIQVFTSNDSVGISLPGIGRRLRRLHSSTVCNSWVSSSSGTDRCDIITDDVHWQTINSPHTIRASAAATCFPVAAAPVKARENNRSKKYKWISTMDKVLLHSCRDQRRWGGLLDLQLR